MSPQHTPSHISGLLTISLDNVRSIVACVQVEYSELILAMIQHGDVLTAAGRPPLPRDKE